MDVDSLEAELRSVGSALTIPAATHDLSAAVMERLATEPTPAAVGRIALLAQAIRRRWRTALASIAGLLLILVAAPPVRATVADWFGFGGVVVRHSPNPGPTTAPAPPAATGGTRLNDARRLITFTPIVPRALGEPSAVEATADHRVLSMSWENTPDGRIRLDEFDGAVSTMFIKSVYGELEPIQVGFEPGWWFPNPHDLVTVDAQGHEHTEAARVAGPTLVWQVGKVTLRLEGNLTKDRAVTIAQSAVN
jgi:hypothetical protein